MRMTPVTMFVTDKFKPTSAGEAPASTPTALLSPSRGTEVGSTQLAPSERRAIAPRSSHATVAAVSTKTVLTRTVSTKAVTLKVERRAFAATTAAGAAPVRSAASRSRLPGDLAIWTAVPPGRAAFATILPIAVARGTFIGGVPPCGLVSLWAIARTPALDHAFLVPTVVAPTNATLIVAFVIASSVTLRTSPLANGSIGRLADSSAISRRPALVETGIVSVPIIICRIGHFAGLNLIGGTGSPVSLADELHHCRRRNSSKKQQRVVAHRQFLRHLRVQVDSPNRRGHRSRNQPRTRAQWTFLVRG
jgi:hypothetical protein